MIFPLEITASGEKFVSCIESSEEYYCLNFAIYCVCWCYFYTVKQQPCRRINNLIIKYSTSLKKKFLNEINYNVSGCVFGVGVGLSHMQQFNNTSWVAYACLHA